MIASLALLSLLFVIMTQIHMVISSTTKIDVDVNLAQSSSSSSTSSDPSAGLFCVRSDIERFAKKHVPICLQSEAQFCINQHDSISINSTCVTDTRS
jgi:hypothetical protein